MEATDIDRNLALIFLQQHRDQFPVVRRDIVQAEQKRQTHLAQVCDEMEAQGEAVTVTRLAKAAHVHRKTVMLFLRQRREGGTHAAAQAR